MNLLLVENDFEGALHQFELVRARHSDDSFILSALAEAHARLGQFDASIRDLEIAHQADPQNGDVLHALGHSLTHLRRFAEAERYYDMAIQADPSAAMLYCDYARLYIFWKGDVHAARQVWERAPSSFMARIICTQGSVQMYEREYDHMIEWYQGEDLDALPPDLKHVSKQNLALLHRFKGDREAEIYLWTKLLSLADSSLVYPPDLKTVSLLGEFHARRSVAYALAGLGRFDEAAKQATLLRSLLRKDRYEQAMRRIHVSIILTMAERYDEALDVIEEDLNDEAGVLSIPYLSLPHFDALRDHPRFKAITAGGSEVQVRPSQDGTTMDPSTVDDVADSLDTYRENGVTRAWF